MRRWLAALGFLLGLTTAAAAQQPFPGGLWAATGWPAVTSGPCEVTGDVTVTNGGLSVQGNASGSPQIAAFGPAPTGQYYVEITMDSGAAAASNGFGICQPAATAANLNTTWTKGIGWQTNGDTDGNGSLLTNVGTLSAGQTVQLAIDTANYRFYAGISGGSGQGGIFQSSAPIFYPSFNSSTYGWSFSGLLPTTTFDFSWLFKAGKSDKFTLNNGGSAFTKIPPMGYAFGWNGVIPNKASYSAWDSGTFAGTGFFGPSNYAFTLTGSGGGARSVNSYAASGKRYLEFAVSQLINNSTWVGLATSAQSLSGGCGGGTCKAITAFGGGLGQLRNDTVGQIAVDLGAKLLWIRGQSSDNWNNNAAANPATGVGGSDISALAFPLYVGAATPANIFYSILISNPSYMTFAAPSGFTAGW